MPGCSILLLDTEPRTHNHYIALSIAEALRRHPAVDRVVVAHHGNALATFMDEGLDTVLAFGGARLHAPLLARLARLARLSLLWTTEDPYERAANVQFSDCFDLVFTNDRGSVDAYGGRARHLPLAASPAFQDFAVGADDRHYLYDLLFVGTAWPNRVASLNAILGRLPSDLKVKIALPWNVHIGPPALDDPSLATDWRCGNTDFARLANRSRVVLTLPRVFSAADTQQAAGTTPPPRLFETALAGGFQVMVSPEPEVRDYYRPDSEILLCDDDAAGAQAIARMLAAPEERLSLARAARARTLAEHLYDHRVETMLSEAARFRRAGSGPEIRPRATVPLRRTILLLTHNRAGRRGGGGVEIYQEVLTGLGDAYDVLFLFPVLHGAEWEMRLEGPGVAESLPCGPVGIPKLTDPHVESLFARILFEHRVDLVHVQHLLHWPLSLPLVARASGVPVVYHLHDHYLICERWLLLDHNGRFCDVVTRGRDQCDACLAAGANYPAGAKARRDSFLRRVVGAVDTFITSTPATGAYLRAFYPQIEPGRIVEIEMLVPTPAPARNAPEQDAPDTEPAAEARRPLVVAVLGNFDHHKGGDDIIELIRTCAAYPIQFRIYGHSSAHHAGRLRGLPPDRVVVCGAYTQSSIVAQLRGCDVSLHLSTWPETYVIALTEAWQAGLVPIVSDLGALSERVGDGIDGFRVAPHDPGAVRSRLLELHFDRTRLARMRSAVRRKTFPSVAAHLSALRGLYARLIAARPCPHNRVPNRRQVPHDLSLNDLALRVNAPSWVTSEVIWDGGRAAGYDEPAEAFRAVERLDALPAAEAALPTLQLPLTHPDLAWALDALWTDRRRRSDRTGQAAVLQSLALRGWLHRAGSQGPSRVYLRIGNGHTVSYAALHAESRQDAANAIGASAARDVGFSGRVDLGDLAFGGYAVDLVQVTAHHRLVTQGLLRIFAMGVHGARSASVFRPAPEPDTHHREPPATAVTQNLPRLDGVLLAAPGEIWAFAARLPPAALTDGLPVQAWLRAADGTHLRLDDPLYPDRDGTVHFAAALTGVRPGGYDVILRTGAGGTQVVPLPDRLQVLAQDSRCLEDAALPGAFRARFIKRIRRAANIDSVTPGHDAEGGERIRCQGWAFQRGLGAPLCVVARWEDAGGPRTCSGASLVRPDLEAHLGTPAALTAGFDLTFPRTAVESGTLRLFQCYRWRTVEFTGFGALLRQATPVA